MLDQYHTELLTVLNQISETLTHIKVGLGVFILSTVIHWTFGKKE
jgi:hypothetical protein